MIKILETFLIIIEKGKLGVPKGNDSISQSMLVKKYEKNINNIKTFIKLCSKGMSIKDIESIVE